MFPFLLPFLLVKYGEITIFCPKFRESLAAGAVGAAATDPGLPGALLGVVAQSGDGWPWEVMVVEVAFLMLERKPPPRKVY